MFRNMDFRGFGYCEMQPHPCVPLQGRADIILSVLVGMCLLCHTKAEVWNFCGSMGNLLAVTDKHCCRCFAQWFLSCVTQVYHAFALVCHGNSWSTPIPYGIVLLMILVVIAL